jgi:hypothetical protein
MGGIIMVEGTIVVVVATTAAVASSRRKWKYEYGGTPALEIISSRHFVPSDS